MMNTPEVDSPVILSTPQFLAHWQGHRHLTRRAIEAFPEDQLFRFSIGGMRPFVAMAWEIQQVSEYTLTAMRTGDWAMPDWSVGNPSDRAELLGAWDTLTARIAAKLPTVDPAFFAQMHTLPWGEMSGWQAAVYTIDNEIHHRGQGYVYLRALGITPPEFATYQGP